MSKNLVVICKNIEEGHKIIVNEKYIINREKNDQKKKKRHSIITHKKSQSEWIGISYGEMFFFT